MAITTIAALTGDTAVAAGTGNAFTTTGAFVIYMDAAVGNREFCTLYRKGPGGGYEKATDEKGKVIRVGGDYPNWVFIDKGGDFDVSKTATLEQSSFGYEEV